MVTQCYLCKQTIDRQASWLRNERNFCNKECYIKYQSTLKADQTNNWKGGRYHTFVCKVCKISCKKRIHRKQLPKYCSIKCASKDRAQGTKGDKHWNWKGGNNSRYIKTIAPRKRPEKCEVCESYGKKRNGIVLDHNHQTGKFRGWLCSNCNTILGLAKENTQTLKLLIKYINENPL